MKGKPNINRLESLRKELQFKDPGIFEKAVYAFNLLNELLRVYPELIFKGGTSLLMHVFPPFRLSIDIDILLPVKERERLKDILSDVVSTSEWFEFLEEDVRVGKKIPKVHYKFKFTSQFTRVPQYVLLDVVFAESPYKNIVKKNFTKHPMIFSDTNAIVQIPTSEGLFGDKMTAISPKTTGIPLNKERSMEFLKQIIDLGELFKIANDIDDIRQTFANTAQQENGFRGTVYSADDVVNDIVDVAFKYSQSMLKGSDNTFPEIALINEGLNRIGNHLRQKVDQRDIKLAFAKIVYVCRIIRANKGLEIIKIVDNKTIEGKTLEGRYKILERLKKINPDAYFYWVLGIG